MERVLSDPGFADDDGAADPRVIAALDAYATGDIEPLALLLPTARLLVPIVAIADGVPQASAEEANEHGAEKQTDMAVVTLRLTDDQVALPVFTSLAALAAWHAQARPLPIAGAKAAQAALAEGADLLLLDPAGRVTAPIHGPALRTLAAGLPPLPVHRDPDVAAALRGHLRLRPDFAAAVLLAAHGADADAVLALVLRDADVDAAAATADLSAVLASDPLLGARLRLGLDLAILPPGTDLPVDRLL